MHVLLLTLFFSSPILPIHARAVSSPAPDSDSDVSASISNPITGSNSNRGSPCAASSLESSAPNEKRDTAAGRRSENGNYQLPSDNEGGTASLDSPTAWPGFFPTGDASEQVVANAPGLESPGAGGDGSQAGFVTPGSESVGGAGVIGGSEDGGDGTLGTAGEGNIDETGAVASNVGGGAFDTALEQDPDTGRPIDTEKAPNVNPDTCTVRRGPEDDDVGFYIVYLIEYPKSSMPTKHPQAILVTDPLTKIDRRYDVYQSGGKILYRRVAPYLFKYPNGVIVEVSRHDKRGLLMAQPNEPKEDALRWFEEIASGTSVSIDSGYKIPQFTRIWVKKVFKALDTAPDSTRYWKKL